MRRSSRLAKKPSKVVIDEDEEEEEKEEKKATKPTKKEKKKASQHDDSYGGDAADEEEEEEEHHGADDEDDYSDQPKPKKKGGPKKKRTKVSRCGRMARLLIGAFYRRAKTMRRSRTRRTRRSRQSSIPRASTSARRSSRRLTLRRKPRRPRACQSSRKFCARTDKKLAGQSRSWWSGSASARCWARCRCASLAAEASSTLTSQAARTSARATWTTLILSAAPRPSPFLRCSAWAGSTDLSLKKQKRAIFFREGRHTGLDMNEHTSHHPSDCTLLFEDGLSVFVSLQLLEQVSTLGRCKRAALLRMPRVVLAESARAADSSAFEAVLFSFARGSLWCDGDGTRGYCSRHLMQHSPFCETPAVASPRYRAENGHLSFFCPRGFFFSWDNGRVSSDCCRRPFSARLCAIRPLRAGCTCLGT